MTLWLHLLQPSRTPVVIPSLPEGITFRVFILNEAFIGWLYIVFKSEISQQINCFKSHHKCTQSNYVRDTSSIGLLCQKEQSLFPGKVCIRCETSQTQQLLILEYVYWLCCSNVSCLTLCIQLKLVSPNYRPQSLIWGLRLKISADN